MRAGHVAGPSHKGRAIGPPFAYTAGPSKWTPWSEDVLVCKLLLSQETKFILGLEPKYGLADVIWRVRHHEDRRFFRFWRSCSGGGCRLAIRSRIATDAIALDRAPRKRVFKEAGA